MTDHASLWLLVGSNENVTLRKSYHGFLQYNYMGGGGKAWLQGMAETVLEGQKVPREEYKGQRLW